MKGKILVTGGTGYIGSHTVVELTEAGYTPVIVDNFYNSRPEVLKRIQKITGREPLFHNVDVTDPAALRSVFEQHPDILAVIHFAAYKAVGESMDMPLEYYHNNLNGVLNLLKQTPKEAAHFVFSSSCTVYGEPDVCPVTEKTPVTESKSVYGNTKKIGEDLFRDVSRSGRAKSISLRYFNPVGAHPSALIGEYPNGVPNNLIPYLTQTAKGIRKEITVYGDDYNTPDGTCIRDYIHVVDLAKAHVAAIEYLFSGKMDKSYDVFNIGTGNGISVKEIIRVFEKVNDLKIPMVIGNRRPGDVTEVWADPRKANELLGWKASLGVEEMMRSAWNWEQRLSQNIDDQL